MQKLTRLDEITLFNGKLTFLIPHEWQETDENSTDLYRYSEPGAESGWFRVSLNTVAATNESAAQRLARIVNESNATRNEETGNWVWSRDRETEENGARIHLYYWFVVNVVQPNLVREAILSYTVLRDRKDNEETKRVLKLLEQIAGLVRFNSDTSTSGNMLQ